MVQSTGQVKISVYSSQNLRVLKLQGADHVLSLPSSAQVDKEFDAFPLECKSVVMNIPETWEEVLPITPPLCIFFCISFLFLHLLGVYV